MGTILLNSSQLKQYAKQVRQLLTELNSMQTDIKASVNELDSSSTGKSAKHASDVMFDCYGKGQKASAGITEISAIVSNAVSLFTELDSRVGNNMEEIYTDPEHAKAFFKREQANVKTEVKSDFVELKKHAKSTESDTFKPEQPETLWGDITSPKFVAAMTVAFGVVAIFSGGCIPLALAAIAFGVLDYREAEGKGNPLKSGLNSGINAVGNKFGIKGGDKVGNEIYDLGDAGVGIMTLACNPVEGASKAGTVLKAGEELGDAIKGGEVLTKSERVINAVKGGDWNISKTGSGLKEMASAVNPIKESVSPVAKFSARCLKNSLCNQSLMDTMKLGKTYAGDMKAALARGVGKSSAKSFISGVGNATKPGAAFNDVMGANIARKAMVEDWGEKAN